MSKLNPSPAIRRRIYETVLVILAIMVGRGYVQSDEAPLWGALAGTILLARFNATTGTSRDAE